MKIKLATIALVLALTACTESATQFGHRRESEENQRIADREAFQQTLDLRNLTEKQEVDMRELTQRVKTLELQVNALRKQPQ